MIAARKKSPHWGPAALQAGKRTRNTSRRLVIKFSTQDGIVNIDDNAYEHKFDQEGGAIRLELWSSPVTYQQQDGPLDPVKTISDSGVIFPLHGFWENRIRAFLYVKPKVINGFFLKQ